MDEYRCHINEFGNLKKKKLDDTKQTTKQK